MPIILTSPRFSWSTRLQKVANNNPPMRYGERGNDVRLIQQALIDLRIHPMTNSIKKYGSPDGIYGSETKSAVKKYQKKIGFTDDGVIGQDTMQDLDSALPSIGGRLPTLPSITSYVVPGLVVARDQLRLGQRNLCWAYTYAMMASWKRQQGTDARQLISDVGSKWLTYFDNNRPLPWSEFSMFYSSAGMRIEPMRSISISQWSQMLRTHGPLIIDGLNNSLGGGNSHIRMLYGVQDSVNMTTIMRILDPWGGTDYGESYENFLAKYEGTAGHPTGQIAHF